MSPLALDAPDKKERRKDPRYPVKRSLLLRFGDIQKLRRTYVRDISKGGMFVRSRKPQPVGTRLSVVLELPDGSRFPLKGEVAAVRDEPEGRGGNGIRFLDLDPSRLAMLESYIDACAAGVPHAILNDDSDISLVNVIEPETEKKLVDELSQAVTQLPRAGLPTLGNQMPASPDFLLRLDRTIRSIERLPGSDAYEVLGVEPHAGFEGVRDVLAQRMAELEVDPSVGKIPARMSGRIQTVKAKLQMASRTLTDAKNRAILDLTRGALIPDTQEPAVKQAFEEELQTRRDKATVAERSEFDLALPFLKLAREKRNEGDLKAARGLFRAALLYDPYNLQIRDVAAEVRAEIRAATPELEAAGMSVSESEEPLTEAAVSLPRAVPDPVPDIGTPEPIEERGVEPLPPPPVSAGAQ